MAKRGSFLKAMVALSREMDRASRQAEAARQRAKREAEREYQRALRQAARDEKAAAKAHARWLKATAQAAFDERCRARQELRHAIEKTVLK